MDDVCDELTQLLDQIPSYTSWAPTSLAELFMSYRGIISSIAAAGQYKPFSWIFEDCPHLEERIHTMLQEQEVEKQRIVFNSIAFELQSAIEVLTGKLHCDDKDAWRSILSQYSSRNT